MGNPLAILILAAGEGKRMGTIKQLLPYQNTSLLEVAIEKAVDTGINSITCVLGAHSESILNRIQIPSNVVPVLNKNWSAGMGTSIVLGVEKNKNSKGILIMLADQPLLSSMHLKTLIQEFEKNSDAAIATLYGGTFGVPAVFPASFFPSLTELEKDNGARVILNSGKYNVKGVSVNEEQLLDIDYPGDYNKLKT